MNPQQNVNPMMLKQQQQQMLMMQNMQKQQMLQRQGLNMQNMNVQQGMQGQQNMQKQNVKRTLDNPDLVKEIQRIVKISNPEEKTETLGETLFYFLLNVISQYKLNITNGAIDDAILSSKLTGMLLQTDENELMEIVSNNEILVMTIRDVIMVI